MKPDIFIHPETKKALKAMAAHPSHATLLMGEPGVGLRTIAKWFAQQTKTQHITEIAPDEKGTISIETIRELYLQTRSKQERRVIIMDDADALTHAAQNAFLKLLEEPTSAISFILTAHTTQTLLHTVRSRVQSLVVRPIDNQDTKALLDSHGVADAKRAQLLFMASGRPATLTRLALDEAYFKDQVENVSDAKQFLQGSAYEKLLIVQRYSTDRAKALQLLSAATTILRFSLAQNPQASLIEQLEKIRKAQEKMGENRHVKMQLLRSVF